MLTLPTVQRLPPSQLHRAQQPCQVPSHPFLLASYSSLFLTYTAGSGQVSYFVNRQLENQHQHHHSLAPLVTQHLGPIGHTINHTRISNNNNNTSWSPQRTSPTTTTVPGVPIRFGTNSQYSPTTTTTTPATPTPTTTATATTTTNNTTSFPIDHTKPYHLRIDMDNIIAAMGPDVTLFNFVHS
eukprot:TRINITY_DN49_c2_g1_i2.p1 TRINITY_DN49_c2_g1~~TRINITY_DN49_c2_g1_i2.p1  ORF type:complete len:184 (+),score=63.61 TRINITY_DN49_c2_g1_i2:280-831(+)